MKAGEVEVEKAFVTYWNLRYLIKVFDMSSIIYPFAIKPIMSYDCPETQEYGRKYAYQRHLFPIALPFTSPGEKEEEKHRQPDTKQDGKKGQIIENIRGLDRTIFEDQMRGELQNGQGEQYQQEPKGSPATACYRRRVWHRRNPPGEGDVIAYL